MKIRAVASSFKMFLTQSQIDCNNGFGTGNSYAKELSTFHHYFYNCSFGKDSKTN